MDKLDQNMKNLIAAVGLEQDDKDTIEFIYDFVDKNGGIEAVKEALGPNGSKKRVTL